MYSFFHGALRGQKLSFLTSILVDVFKVSVKFVLNNIQGKQCKDSFVLRQINQSQGNNSSLFYDFI